MIKDSPSSSPRLLGYLGLLPVIAPTLLLIFDPHHSLVWSHLLLSYAAIILVFVGALHWAFAMTIHALSPIQRRFAFIWSVIPSLVAWASLFINTFFASVLLAIFFILNLLKDKELSKIVIFPGWYLPLRSRLTFVVVTCLTMTAVWSKFF